LNKQLTATGASVKILVKRCQAGVLLLTRRLGKCLTRSCSRTPTLAQNPPSFSLLSQKFCDDLGKASIVLLEARFAPVSIPGAMLCIHALVPSIELWISRKGYWDSLPKNSSKACVFLQMIPGLISLPASQPASLEGISPKVLIFCPV
jgi:hypothetical protein